MPKLLKTATAMIGTLFLVIAFFVSAPASMAEDEGQARELTLGILAYRGLDEVRTRWPPLADYLGKHVPGITVRVQPLLRHEAEARLDKGELHLVLVNPYDYAWLEASRSVIRIATLRPRGMGDVAPMFGAVVLVRADSSFDSLEDLRGKKIVSPAPDSFPALMIQRELHLLGYDPARFFGALEYTGLPQSRTVERVLGGGVDAGIVRTGVLEALVARGRVTPGAYRILPPPTPVAFGQPVSSRLYPEWPMATASSIEPSLARHNLSVLLTIQPDDPVAIAAEIDGWAPPLDTAA